MRIQEDEMESSLDQPKDDGTKAELVEAGSSQSNTTTESANDTAGGNGSEYVTDKPNDGAAETDAKPASDSQPAAEGESAPALAPELSPRRTRWQGFLDACKYLQKLYSDEGVKFRKTDLISSRFLIASALGLVVLFFVQSGPFSDVVAVVVDVSVALSVVIYIINRFGIMLTLSPRQALLVTEIIIGVCVLVTLITVNCYYLLFRVLNTAVE